LQWLPRSASESVFPSMQHIFRTSFTSHMCVFRACNLCADQANKHVQGFFIWVSYHDEHARALAARASTQICHGQGPIWSVNALTSAVVTEQVPINTNFSPMWLCGQGVQLPTARRHDMRQVYGHIPRVVRSCGQQGRCAHAANKCDQFLPVYFRNLLAGCAENLRNRSLL